MKVTLLVFMLVMLSCGDKNVKGDLAALMSKEVAFPQMANVTIHGKDTTINDLFESDLKMVIYTDSESCNGCMLSKLYLWQELIDYSEKYKGKLKFYFIFNPPENENIEKNLKTNLLEYPMIIDRKGEFEKLNPQLPKNKALHAFLLDKDNKVIMVGNPLQNTEVEKLFYKEIEKRLGKPNN